MFEKLMLPGNRKTQRLNNKMKLKLVQHHQLTRKHGLTEEPDLNPQKDKFITSDINNSQENVGVIGSRFKI